ncbi:MAG: hypothetical protein ACQESH_01430 [Campylobacterota bacterium]
MKGFGDSLHKEQLLGVFVAFLVAAAFFLSIRYSCFGIVFLLPILLFLVYNNFEFSMVKKRCIANCLLNEGNFIYSLMTSRVWLFLRAVVLAFVMIVLFIAIVATFTPLFWLLYLLDIALIYLMYERFNRFQIYKAGAKDAIIKNQVALVNALLLSALFFVMQLYQTPPSYILHTLDQTMEQATAGVVFSQCGVFDTFLSLNREFTALKWWSMLRAEGMLGNSYMSAGLWVVFLLGHFVAHMTWSKYLLEVQSFIHKKVQKQNSDAAKTKE